MATVRTAPRPGARSARPGSRRPRPAAPRRAARPARPATAFRPRPLAGAARRRRRQVSLRDVRWPIAVLALAVLAGLAWQLDGPPAARPVRCTVAGTSVDLSPEQATNARTIAAVARERTLPDRALTIALATAAQESHLRNLPYGDRDSLGLFQQRPSQGWGTAAQVQDPVYATGRFFDHLVQVPGWDTGRLTDVAQAVQRSGVPEGYQRWESTATALAGALLSERPAPLVCR